MESVEINEGWDRIKAKIRRRFNHITEDQLHFEPGKEEELLDNLQKLTRLDRVELVFMIRKMQAYSTNNRL